MAIGIKEDSFSARENTYAYPAPLVTTTERGALSGMSDGAQCYDITLHQLFVYENNAWVGK